jgi:hypothetical protein
MFQNALAFFICIAVNRQNLYKLYALERCVGDDEIAPGECASFHIGDIVVTDFSNELLSPGCTHLHPAREAFLSVAPLEASEDHFGILTLQVDELLLGNGRILEIEISVVTATLGLYIANQI